MDYKTLEKIQSSIKKDAEFFAKKTEECAKYGAEYETSQSFNRGTLFYAEALITYLEDLKEIYA